MSAFAHERILPVEETLAHKTDVLDWSVLGAENGDLEFRGDFRLSRRATFGVVPLLLVQLSLVSLVAWVLARSAGIWIAPLLPRAAAAMVSVAVGFAWALLAEATRCAGKDEEMTPLVEPAVLGRLLLPPLLWQAITLTGQLDLLAGAFQYYVLVSLPLAILVFDRFATHAVHWITASPTSDHTAMTLGRRAWTWRLFGFPSEQTQDTAEPQAEPDPVFDAVIHSTMGYRWGFLWIAVATLAPTTLIALTGSGTKPTTIGLQLVVGTLFGLLAAVVLRSGGNPRIVTGFFRMLVHWFYYGWKDRLPPWVLHSPSGGWFQRQLSAFVAVGLFAVPLTSLAAHSFAGLLEAAKPQAATANQAHSVPDHVAAGRSLLSTEATHNAAPWLWIAPTVLVAFTVPVMNFCLMGMLLTGRVISAYQDAFETPLGPVPLPSFPAEDEGDSTPAGEGQLP